MNESNANVPTDVSERPAPAAASRLNAFIAMIRGHLKAVSGLIALAASIGLVLKGLLGFVDVYKLTSSLRGSSESIVKKSSSSSIPRMSIIVLPFANLSSGSSDEIFVDGLTDDLTTDLSHIDGSFVIARNTAYTYKGKPVDIKQLGIDLGVRYVLEGSVRRIDSRVVLNAQLISTESGAQIWTDRFEGESDRLGELQADFVARLARSLDVQLTQAESLRALRERSNNPDAADLAMQGWSYLNNTISIDNTQTAIQYFEKSLSIDPSYPKALIGMAKAKIQRVTADYSQDKNADREAAKSLINKIPNKSDDYLALYTQGEIFRTEKNIPMATAMFEAALEANRNFPLSYVKVGYMKIAIGAAAESFPFFYKAIKLSPNDPQINTFEFMVCHAHAHLGQWQDAIPWCTKSIAHGPLWFAYADLAAAYGWLGNKTQASDTIEELIKIKPGFTAKKWDAYTFSGSAVSTSEHSRITEGLRRAGLQEQ